MTTQTRAQHTPGPWEVIHEIYGHPVSVTSAGWPLADVDGNTDDEAEANARLIAAAPDLYKALVVALDADILRKAIELADGAIIARICDEYQDLHQDMTEDEALVRLTEMAREVRYRALQKACPPLWPDSRAKATGVQS